MSHRNLERETSRRGRATMVKSDVLAQVVESALEQVQGDRRWTNAIKRGADLIQKNRCLFSTAHRTERGTLKRHSAGYRKAADSFQSLARG